VSFDPDKIDERIIQQAIRMYEEQARRLSTIVFQGPGSNNPNQEWTHARASVKYAQIQTEIDRLQRSATDWTSHAMSTSLRVGINNAQSQLVKSGIVNPKAKVDMSFAVLDRSAVKVVATDAADDFEKAAISMGDNAKTALRRMAATGVTNAEVNKIIAGGIISGKPTEAIRELRETLRKVHGDFVTITNKNGGQTTFKVGYYAEMVARTKTREAVVTARHETFRNRGIDLVKITGSDSANFCTAFVNKVYSLSGNDPEYPSINVLPGDGPPFHPNCTKSTSPFSRAIASDAQLRAAKPDALSVPITKDTAALDRQFKDSHGQAAAKQRTREIADDIRARAKANNYQPPPSGLVSGKNLPVSENDSTEYQEYLARQLSVKNADFANRPDIGANVVQAFQSASRQQILLPNTAKVTTEKFLDSTGKPDPNIFAGHAAGAIYFNPAWPGWRGISKATQKLFDDGLISTPNPHHIVFHEIAHNDAVARKVDHRNAKFILKQEFDIARQVSRRAAVNKDEFIAEVKAGLMSGRTFSKEVMSLYKKMGGK